VDVLVVEVPVELAAFDLADDLGHAAFDVGEIGLADDAWRASILAWASEPRISWAAMRLSKNTLAV